jgi:hypothetical protein
LTDETGNPLGRLAKVDANVHRLLSERQNDRPEDLRTALVPHDELMTWWEQMRALGDDAPNPPEPIARELERLRLLVEFDEADLAELVDGDLATARQRGTWAIRCFRLWREHWEWFRPLYQKASDEVA